jgi:demethylmenaquinone methyltransferase/2-methoxy-6-polyprenyl-1,4-benzoquinol methylase
MPAKYEKTISAKVVFWMISLMHDNRLLPLIKNPYRILENAGLVKGQQVLEVGCGPGYFTLPAAEIVGRQGHVYAVDVNPYAIERVRKKVANAGIKNVTPMLGNASETGLPDQSLELAFLFGLPRVEGGRPPLLKELARIIKPGGTVLLQKSRAEEQTLVLEMTTHGFTLAERKGRMFVFQSR